MSIPDFVEERNGDEEPAQSLGEQRQAKKHPAEQKPWEGRLTHIPPEEVGEQKHECSEAKVLGRKT